jgi:hypothetical protein
MIVAARFLVVRLRRFSNNSTQMTEVFPTVELSGDTYPESVRCFFKF